MSIPPFHGIEEEVDNKEPSEDWKIWRKVFIAGVLQKDAIRLSRKYGKIPVEDNCRLLSLYNEQIADNYY
ncbi:hypothetical protein MASR1M12_13870 [Erysipelotrichia bacterium]